jgi:hypothetical protein
MPKEEQPKEEQPKEEQPKEEQLALSQLRHYKQLQMATAITSRRSHMP